jgi:RNA recognition motif-containing protein
MSVYGKIESCYILKDNVTNKSKRYGFVVYYKAEHAQLATSDKKTHILNNSTINIKSFALKVKESKRPVSPSTSTSNVSTSLPSKISQMLSH